MSQQLGILSLSENFFDVNTPEHKTLQPVILLDGLSCTAFRRIIHFFACLTTSSKTSFLFTYWSQQRPRFFPNCGSLKNLSISLFSFFMRIKRVPMLYGRASVSLHFRLSAVFDLLWLSLSFAMFKIAFSECSYFDCYLHRSFSSVSLCAVQEWVFVCLCIFFGCASLFCFLSFRDSLKIVFICFFVRLCPCTIVCWCLCLWVILCVCVCVCFWDFLFFIIR